MFRIIWLLVLVRIGKDLYEFRQQENACSFVRHGVGYSFYVKFLDDEFVIYYVYDGTCQMNTVISSTIEDPNFDPHDIADKIAVIIKKQAFGAPDRHISKLD